MFAFEWLFGFGFWVLYILLGFIFCVVYMRIFAKKCYRVLMNDNVEIDFNDSDYYTVDEESVNIFEVGGIVIISFLAWPVLLVAGLIWVLLVLLSKVFIVLFIKSLKLFAAYIPEFEIKKKEDKDDH